MKVAFNKLFFYLSLNVLIEMVQIQSNCLIVDSNVFTSDGFRAIYKTCYRLHFYFVYLELNAFNVDKINNILQVYKPDRDPDHKKDFENYDTSST